MPTGKIYFNNGDAKPFIRLDNVIACCNRLNGEELKLLGQIMNIVNIDYSRGITTTEVKLPRNLLTWIFNNCTMESILNYAKSLKELGFIESFSRDGGDNGDFIFLVKEKELFVNNPYVLLGVIENQVIESFRYSGKSSRDFLKAMKTATIAVQKDYVKRLKNANDSKKKEILEEYQQYLCEQLIPYGSFSPPIPRSTLPKTKQSTEHNLPESVNDWSKSDFTTYFSSRYKEITKKNHTKSSKKSGTLEQCISKVIDLYSGDKIKTKSHIDKFFKGVPYDNKMKTDPQAYFMADTGLLERVNAAVESGVPFTLYENREHQDKHSTNGINQNLDIKEAVQENKGIDVDKFLKAIYGEEK
ncbi:MULTISPECIES: hypothetical protein [Paenibacillus]|uniref:Uncharacterized protein n=1 Tax=Paenibacillus odorifer TaxID=189426 RepID=A0ABX3HJQ2_9BACL|nr:hypothetical protein [Paenibacillus odorifer]OMD50449.1 hypothetical protein BSK51_15855 [Paenibacillus odorifer]